MPSPASLTWLMQSFWSYVIFIYTDTFILFLRSGSKFPTDSASKPKQTHLYEVYALPLSSVPSNKAGIHMFDACKWVQMCSLRARRRLWSISTRSADQSWAECQQHNNTNRIQSMPQTNVFLLIQKCFCTASQQLNFSFKMLVCSSVTMLSKHPNIGHKGHCQGKLRNGSTLIDWIHSLWQHANIQGNNCWVLIFPCVKQNPVISTGCDYEGNDQIL